MERQNILFVEKRSNSIRKFGMRIKIEMHGDSSDINAVAVVKNIKVLKQNQTKPKQKIKTVGIFRFLSFKRGLTFLG